jgi:hypothetical protein
LLWLAICRRVFCPPLALPRLALSLPLDYMASLVGDYPLRRRHGLTDPPVELQGIHGVPAALARSCHKARICEEAERRLRYAAKRVPDRARR